MEFLDAPLTLVWARRGVLLAALISGEDALVRGLIPSIVADRLGTRQQRLATYDLLKERGIADRFIQKLAQATAICAEEAANRPSQPAPGGNP